MSPEAREYFYKVVQKERADRENKSAKSVVNAPKNWGTSTNKRMSVTASWRK